MSILLKRRNKMWKRFKNGNKRLKKRERMQKISIILLPKWRMENINFKKVKAKKEKLLKKNQRDLRKQGN